MKRKSIFKIDPKLIYILLLSGLIVSCAKEEEPIAPSLSPYNESVVSYFKEVALGFEFGNVSEITRRWESDMKIFIGGQPSPELLAETNRIVDEINALTTTGFDIEVVSDTLQSNYYIFFGSGDAYAQIFPSSSNLVGSNWGLFSLFWDGSQTLNTGYMYVDIFRATLTEQKHLLREELTQSLGLAKDSNRFPESIFQQSFSTKTNDYAAIDRDLIRLLYHPEMRAGLDKNQVDRILRRILLAEQ